MGSLFVNPALLWGAAAIAAPILIFLLTRYRYRTVEFAALVFLQRALRREQRRLNLENLLLLLIRCLALIILALALARPRIQADVPTNPDDVRKNVLIAVDASYSMGYQLGSDDEETAFERARRAAKELVTGLEPGDRVMLVVFDESVRVVYGVPKQMDEGAKKEVTADLDDTAEAAPVRRGERGTDLVELFQALPRTLERFDFGPDGQPPPAGFKPLKKTVFLLTDASRHGVLDASGALVDGQLGRAAKDIQAVGAELVLIDCGADEPRNVGLTRLAPVEPVVGQGLACHIECSVKNWSATDANDLTVEYFVDGAAAPQKVVSLSVPAGEERAPEALRYVFKEAGSHRVEVQVKSDALVLDNRRHVVVDVRRSVRVLLVDGEPSREEWQGETSFLYQALALSEQTGDDGFGLLHPEVTDEAGLPGHRLSEYDVVLLANVSQLAEDGVSALEAFARAGGAVIFSLGSMVDRGAYDERLWRRGAGLFPCSLKEARGGTWVDAQDRPDAPAWSISLADPTHPAVSLFASEEMRAYLKAPTIYGFVEGEVPVAENGKLTGGVAVPLRLVPRTSADAPDPGNAEAGAPLLIEKPFGRGRCVVFTSTIDFGWNNTVTHDVFYIPFWRQLVLDLAQRARPPVNLPVGGRFERWLRSEEYAPKVEVETPDGHREAVVLEKLEADDTWRLAFPPEGSAEREGLEQSGLYLVTRRGGAGEEPPAEAFAVAIDPDEGDLAKMSAEELGEALDVPVKPVKPDGGRDALRAEGGASSTREFWRHAVVALVILLALESALAAFFGRRRT